MVEPMGECMTNPATVLTFLLVPDASAARRVRRLVAERGACSGMLVGSWGGLVDAGQRAYLVRGSPAGWDEAFEQALAAMPDAFWSKSFAVAPVETARAIETALVQLFAAHAVGQSFDGARLEALPERPRRHVRDLLGLVERLDGRLPDGLAAIRDLLAADVVGALHAIRVVRVEGVPPLTVWQQALVDKLNRDATRCGAGDPDPALSETLSSVLCASTPARAAGALTVLQRRLFREQDRPEPLDTSVQWVGVRDFVQEAEVAAGMVQRILAEHPELRPADIGLLVPERFEYALALKDAFGLAGLPLSGLQAEHWRRDLGREAVFHFLYCRQRPAPAMALAVCLASPLMPWSREEGARLAQLVMDGDYTLRAPRSAALAAKQMLALMRGEDRSTVTLAPALREFAGLLDGGEAFAAHRLRARETVERLCDLLEDEAEIDWVPLRRAAQPRFLPSGEVADFNREGVTVWRESQEAWRPVRRLLVLGFAQGHYPAAPGTSPVFSNDEIVALRDGLGLSIMTPADERAIRRERLRRQLGAVTEAVTFLVPRRDFAGQPQAPADSLIFMHPLFTGAESASERVLDIEAASLRGGIAYLGLAAPAAPETPRLPPACDLQFDRDLLALRRRHDGSLRPESPSGLETLMVSRLAWLLRRLQAEPPGWAPESADVRLLGTLAHTVFEQLFRPGTTLLERDGIEARTHALLDAAIRERAPFLLAPPWQVERRHLAGGIARAAQAWRDALEALDAEVLGGEVWLQGTWAGIPIHGQADLILGLPGERLLVVDYKRSKSKGRLEQMRNAFDSQANLYRTMLQTGGLKNTVSTPLAQRLKQPASIGTVYYMMNDQTSLADTAVPGARAIPNWLTVDHDVSGAAMDLIRQRLDEVRSGLVTLNRAGDAEFFNKEAGITPYALENSPLVALFTVPDTDAEGAP